MIDEKQFDGMISGFYRAATGAIGWNEALAPVQAAFGLRAAVMQSIDMQTGRMLHFAHGGEPMHAAVLDYLRHWREHDPRRAHLLGHPDELIDRWWHCHEHFDADFVARDPFYREFLPAHDSRYLANTATLVAPTVVTTLGLELPAARGPLSADERHVAERLGRHVTEALRAHERVRRMAAQALAGHGLLDAFSYPMWLLGAERYIFHANAAAREGGDVVAELAEASNQRLALRADRADRLLGSHLQALGDGRHGMRATIDVRARRSDPASWMHLNALEPQRVLGAFGDRPLVLATLFDPRQMRELDPFALGDLFGMTPTQAKVATLMAEGLPAKTIALRLDCGVSTVRTHIGAVLHKLGATRMADAVRLLRQGEALWSLPAERYRPA